MDRALVLAAGRDQGLALDLGQGQEMNQEQVALQDREVDQEALP